MSLDKLNFTKDWTKPEDFSTVETNEERVRADQQLLFDEIKTFLNTKLIPALEKLGVESTVLLPTSAGFKYIRLNADKVLEVSTDGATWQATGSSGLNAYSKTESDTLLSRKATILTSNIGIYVSTTGSDTTGDGSSGKPFRTIQHAIDSIPPVLNGNGVSIIVAAGTYDEDVVIRGKCASQGYRPISINGASSKAEAVNYKVRSIYIAGTGMGSVNIKGFKFTGPSDGSADFCSYGDSCAYLSYCVLDSASKYGILIGDRPYSHLCIADSTISNKTKSAISTEFGNIVQVYRCDGKNNAAVFKANGDQGFGGMIFDCGANTISGTVAEVKGYGGQIFK